MIGPGICCLQDIIFRRLLGILLLGAMSVLTGCNHLFYYPTKIKYIDPKAQGFQYEERFVDTKDGERLVLWDFEPKGQERGTILHFHGNAQNISTHFLFVVWMTKHGYRVITFDYRGYGGSSGKPSREGLIKDGAAILANVCQQSKSPLFVLGQSLGGAVVVPVLALADQDQMCACALVLESTFASYRSLARDKLASFFLTWPLQYPLSFLISDARSPQAYAEHLELPLVMIHGENDPIIPLVHGKSLYEAFSHQDREFWLVEAGGHTQAFIAGQPFPKQLLQYLEKQAASCR